MLSPQKIFNPNQAGVSESLIRQGGRGVRGANWPAKEIGCIGYIFAFYATKIRSRDSGYTKVDPHLV